MPRTSVRSSIPAGRGKNRSAEEEERAHNEHTDSHREDEAECMRTFGNHSSKLKVLAEFSKWRGRV